MRALLLLLASLLLKPAFALEPQNPLSLCERFIDDTQKSQCEKRMQALQPDWYLAAACDQAYNDNIFYECLSLQRDFSPEKLAPCMSEELSDTARMNCIKQARSPHESAFQSHQVKPKKTATPDSNRRQKKH